MPYNRLAAQLSCDGRRAASRAAEQLADHELEGRAVEIASAHHEPGAGHVNEDTEDADPLVAVCRLCSPSGERSGDAGGEDVRLTRKKCGLATSSRAVDKRREELT